MLTSDDLWSASVHGGGGGRQGEVAGSEVELDERARYMAGEKWAGDVEDEIGGRGREGGSYTMTYLRACSRSRRP